MVIELGSDFLNNRNIMLQAFANITSSTMSIPIATFMNHNETVLMQVGVSIPSILGIQNLDKLGIYDYKFMEKVAKSCCEPTPTLTAKWMDATGPFKDLFPSGVQGQWHRTMHGHSLDNVVTVFNNPDLKIVDFFNHLVTDVVTKNGIPLPFSKEIIETVSKATGVSPSKIAPWVSMNLLDIGASALSVWNAGKNVMAVYRGKAQWGFSYGLKTIGVGALEIAGGIGSENPIMVGTGAVNISCGVTTAYRYYTQPKIFGVPIKTVFSSAAWGMALSSMFTGVEIYLRRNELSTSEKYKMLAKSALEGGFFAALGAVSMPVSITASAGYSLLQASMREAEKTNDYIRKMPIRSDFSDKWLDNIVEGYDNSVEIKDMDNKLLDMIRRHKKNGF